MRTIVRTIVSNVMRVFYKCCQLRDLRQTCTYERFVKPAVGHDLWGINCHCYGTALPKCDWVVQEVISSCSDCLFVLCKAG